MKPALKSSKASDWHLARPNGVRRREDSSMVVSREGLIADPGFPYDLVHLIQRFASNNSLRALDLGLCCERFLSLMFTNEPLWRYLTWGYAMRKLPPVIREACTLDIGAGSAAASA